MIKTETLNRAQEKFLRDYTITPGRLLSDFKYKVRKVLKMLREENFEQEVVKLEKVFQKPTIYSVVNFRGTQGKIRETLRKLEIDEVIIDIILKERRHLTKKFVEDKKDLIKTLENEKDSGRELLSLWNILTRVARSVMKRPSWYFINGAP